jgi:hypothetical protein
MTYISEGMGHIDLIVNFKKDEDMRRIREY